MSHRHFFDYVIGSLSQWQTTSLFKLRWSINRVLYKLYILPIFSYCLAYYNALDITCIPFRVVVEAGTSETKTETKTWVAETKTEAI